MFQSFFKLDENNENHMKALRYTMGKSYSRIRSELHLNDYKIHCEGIDPEDSASMANAIANARATLPNGICQEQWLKICDSFEEETWKVNMSF
jgi:hypothetical protein